MDITKAHLTIMVRDMDVSISFYEHGVFVFEYCGGS